eukprot:gene9204-10908_t
MALQKLSKECGLDHLSGRAFVEHVRAIMPDQEKSPSSPAIAGGGKVDQLGIFTSAAPGVSMSNLAFSGKTLTARTALKNVNSSLIREAAIYDLLFCCADRHAQNIFIDEEHNIKLIDNDQMLGGSQKGRAAAGSCTPSSLFLPMNMESWRVNKATSGVHHLDYRCHLAEGESDITLPDSVRTCVSKLSEMSVEGIIKNYDISKPKAAEMLK